MNLLTTLRQYHIPFSQGSQDWLRLECPQCRQSGRTFEDRTLSLHTRGRGGNCWRCGWDGTTKEILTTLSITLHEETEIPRLEAPTLKSFIQHIPQESVEASTSVPALDYLASRGLTAADAIQYAMYFCPDGYYTNRLILPIFDRYQEYRSFVSRHIGTELPKYKYPKGCQISSLLYNLGSLPRPCSSVVLVEGVFDCIHTSSLNSVAMFGKRISHVQVDMLRTVGVQEVTMLLDSEAREHTPEICEANMQKLSRHFITYEVRLPSQTPTEYSVEELEELCYHARQVG